MRQRGGDVVLRHMSLDTENLGAGPELPAFHLLAEAGEPAQIFGDGELDDVCARGTAAFDQPLGRQAVGRFFDGGPADIEDLDQIHLPRHFSADLARLGDAVEDDLLHLVVEGHGRPLVQRESLGRSKEGVAFAIAVSRYRGPAQPADAA